MAKLQDVGTARPKKHLSCVGCVRPRAPFCPLRFWQPHPRGLGWWGLNMLSFKDNSVPGGEISGAREGWPSSNQAGLRNPGMFTP